MIELPLRLSQERALLLCELLGGSEVMRQPFRFVSALRFTEQPDVTALEQALRVIVRRHQVLQMSILPSQRVKGRARELPLSAFARTGLFVPGLYIQMRVAPQAVLITQSREAVRTEDGLLQQIEQEMRLPFNLSTPPPLRARLIPVESRGHLLVLTISHLVSDAWSVGILQRELVQAYVAILQGRPCSPGRRQAQAPQFALWEWRQLLSGAFDASIAYWNALWEKFRDSQVSSRDFGATVACEAGTAVSAVEERVIDGDLAAAIVSGCRRARITPCVYFRAAVALALHRFTGRAKIAFRGNFANRSGFNANDAIGWFSNQHLAAADFSATSSAVDVLQEAREATLTALAHHAVPQIALNRGNPGLGVPGRPVCTFDYYRAPEDADVSDGVVAVAQSVRSLVTRLMPAELDIHVVNSRGKLTKARIRPSAVPDGRGVKSRRRDSFLGALAVADSWVGIIRGCRLLRTVAHRR